MDNNSAISRFFYQIVTIITAIFSFYFNIHEISLMCQFLSLLPTLSGMASKGVRAISCQVTRKAEAGYKPSHTTETFIGYTACYGAFFYAFMGFICICPPIAFNTFIIVSN